MRSTAGKPAGPRARRVADRARAPRRRPRAPLEPPTAGHGLGILIVEDDDDSRDLLRTFLGAQGYPVMAVKHGQEALDCLRDFAAPCLILLDLLMPVMDGWAFRRRLLADPLHASIPVVVVSAVDHAEREISGLNVIGYLPKPLNLDELLRLVKQHCQRAGRLTTLGAVDGRRPRVIVALLPFLASTDEIIQLHESLAAELAALGAVDRVGPVDREQYAFAPVGLLLVAGRRWVFAVWQARAATGWALLGTRLRLAPRRAPQAGRPARRPGAAGGRVDERFRATARRATITPKASRECPGGVVASLDGLVLLGAAVSPSRSPAVYSGTFGGSPRSSPSAARQPEWSSGEPRAPCGPSSSSG